MAAPATGCALLQHGEWRGVACLPSKGGRASLAEVGEQMRLVSIMRDYVVVGKTRLAALRAPSDTKRGCIISIVPPNSNDPEKLHQDAVCGLNERSCDTYRPLALPSRSGMSQQSPGCWCESCTAPAPRDLRRCHSLLGDPEQLLATPANEVVPHAGGRSPS